PARRCQHPRATALGHGVASGAVGRARAAPAAFPSTSARCRPAMDMVFIEALAVDCVIGIYDWERRVHQRLLFDLELGFDNRKPAATDDIADTLDYKAISRR